MAYKLKIRYMYRSTFNYSSTACHNFNFTLSIYKTLIFITLIFLPKTYAKENLKKTQRSSLTSLSIIIKQPQALIHGHYFFLL